MTNGFRASVALVLSLSVAHCATSAAVTARPSQRVVDDPVVVQRYVSNLPIGSTVKLRLTSGEKFTAVLMAVDPAAVVVKPKTRIVEPARTVPLNTIVSIEPVTASGIGAGKAILIGAAAGAAAFFGILFFAIISSD
jgi:hypothetical protein